MRTPIDSFALAPMTVLLSLLAACGGSAGPAGGGGGSSSSSSSGGSSSGGGTLAECTAAPLRTTGSTHYYCECATGAASGCVAGSDASAGVDPAHPRRSFADAITTFNSMPAGDTVALCRGGAWDGVGTNVISNSGCGTGAQTCDLRDYSPPWGSSASPRPRINATDGAYVLAFWNGTLGGFRFWNLDIREGLGSFGDGIVQVTTDLHDTDFCGNSFTGAGLSMNFQPTGTYDSHLSVRANQFRSTHFAGFYGGAPGITITGNEFVDNGLGADMLQHSVYLISECPRAGYTPYCTGSQFGPPYDAAGPATYTFSDNHLVAGSYCAGTILVLHGAFVNNRVVVENNLIETTSANPYCYGIMLSGGLSGAEFHGMIFRRNRVKAQPGQSGIEIDCCQDCVVSDNVVSGGGTFSVSTAACTPGGFAGARGTYQNNTVHGGGLVIGDHGSGPYDLDSNAVWVSGGSCYSTQQLGRNGHNYCAVGTPLPSELWVNPDAAVFGEADFRPAAASPLIGYGDPARFSPVAIGSAVWNASDAGVARSPPIDAGALVH